MKLKLCSLRSFLAESVNFVQPPEICMLDFSLFLNKYSLDNAKVESSSSYYCLVYSYFL